LSDKRKPQKSFRSKYKKEVHNAMKYKGITESFIEFEFSEE
jgi:hypothetical protein